MCTLCSCGFGPHWGVAHITVLSTMTGACLRNVSATHEFIFSTKFGSISLGFTPEYRLTGLHCSDLSIMLYERCVATTELELQLDDSNSTTCSDLLWTETALMKLLRCSEIYTGVIAQAWSDWRLGNIDPFSMWSLPEFCLILAQSNVVSDVKWALAPSILLGRSFSCHLKTTQSILRWNCVIMDVGNFWKMQNALKI